MPKKLRLSHQASNSILDCDRLIAPVHLAVHWTCAVADLKAQELLYLDSMGVSVKSNGFATASIAIVMSGSWNALKATLKTGTASWLKLLVQGAQKVWSAGQRARADGELPTIRA